MKFNCSDCGQKLEVDPVYAGQQTKCPSCGAIVQIPEGEPAIQPAEINTMILQTLPGSASEGEPAAAAPPTVESGGSSGGGGGGEMTIAQFMSDRKMDGGISLGQDALTSDQNRKYEYGDVVARGGMGAIISATDQNIRRQVAMKVLLDPNAASNLEILRFIEEAQVTGQLEHPSVVPVHDLGVDAAGNVFYTMKFVKGHTLHAILTKISKNDRAAVDEFSLGKLLTIFQKVCDAMAFAHSKSVIHRDLKPENIMVGQFGEVSVMDWGLAKVLGREGDDNWASADAIDSVRNQDADGALATIAGTVFGTPQFMAPEQAQGDTRAMDPRTDIYALGAILYNILTLHPPVEGKTLDEILTKVSRGEIITPTSYNTAKDPKRVTPVRGLPEKVRLRHLPGERVPEALAAVVMKAMATDQAARYQKVADLQQDIEAFQGGFATTAEEAGLFKQLSLFIRRNKLATFAAVTIFALVVGFLVTTVLNLNKIQSVSRQAAPEFVHKAQEALEGKRPEDAKAAVATAISLHPKNPEAWLERGRLQLDEDDFSAATASFAKAQTYAGDDDPELRALATSYITFIQNWRPRLAESGGKPTHANIFEMAPELQQFDPVLAGRFFARTPDVEAAQRIEVETVMQQLLAANPGLEWKPGDPENWALGIAGFYWHHVFRETGMEFRVGHAVRTADVVNIEPLTRLPLHDLSLNSTQVSDLTPLQRIPTLRWLDIGYTPILSLDALEGLQLERLRVGNTRIEDLSPLAGMPLKHLEIPHTLVSDISPLAGMPLEYVELRSTQIENIDALRGMPLKTVDLSGLAQLKSIEPLRGAPIEILDLRQNFEVSDNSPIADMPLRSLALGTGDPDLSPIEGKTFETLTLQMNLENVRILSSCTVTDRLNLYIGDLESLEGIESQRTVKHLVIQGENPRITNLERIRGLPLEAIDLNFMSIANLSALEGMNLREISLHLPNLRDLSFLRGMDPESITIAGPVTDLSPLEGMRKVQYLTLNECPDLTDLSVLETMPNLYRVVLPPQVKPEDIEFLRDRENMQDLGYQSHYSFGQFWRDADGNQ